MIWNAREDFIWLDVLRSLRSLSQACGLTYRLSYCGAPGVGATPGQELIEENFSQKSPVTFS